MRRVLTRDQFSRLPRARWLLPVVVLVLVLGTLVVTQRSRQALAADTRGATEIASVANNGTQGSGPSDEPAISADGRFVAFSTTAALDPVDQRNDTSGHVERDIYVRDTLAGHTSTTYLTHGFVGDDGGTTLPSPSEGDSSDPYMSASGRYIGFVSTAANITGEPGSSVATVCDRGAPNPTTGAFGSDCHYTILGTTSDSAAQLSADATRAAYVHGANAEVVNLSLNAAGEIAFPTAASFFSPPLPDPLTVNGVDLHPQFDREVRLSANGRYLLRVSQYANTDAGRSLNVLMLNDLNNPTAPATRFDFATSATTFVSTGNNFIEQLAISGDGRRIAFTEQGGAQEFQVHAIDRDPDGNGVFGPGGGQPITADTVSRNVSGAIVGGLTPSFSTDGRYLAFATDAGAVHNGSDDTSLDVSCVHRPVVQSHTTPLEPQAAGPGSARMRLAADTGISNCDVVVRDLVQDAQRAAAGLPRLPAELASPSETRTCGNLACEGNGDSDTPVLTADGSAVAFVSIADDLVAAPNSDRNGQEDVFKRTFTPAPVVAPLNFGDVTLNGSATGTAQVTHQGFGPLLIKSITVGGPQGGDFDVFPGQTCTGVALHPGETCSVSVRFRPGALGTRTGTLTLTTNTGVQGIGTLTGNGVPEPPPEKPGFQAQPDPLDFGTHPLFTPLTPQSVTVTNTGTAPLAISAVSLIGSAPTNFPGDYQITTNTCLATAVAPKATCQVTLTFAPQAVGARPALLQFTDNVTPGPQLVGLTGTGGAPTLVASPPLAPPGAVSQVTGTGFPPGKVVVLTLDLMPGQVPVTVPANGTFTVPLVVFPHTQYGKRQLHATVQGVPTPIVVSIDFTVVPGSLQPPDFAERR